MGDKESTGNKELVVVFAARRFAKLHHDSQLYGKRPYSYHLEQVVTLVGKYGFRAMVIGYLHDVVEDTPVEVVEIEDHFGPLVANCVALLTDEPGETRKIKKGRTYAKLAKVPQGAPEELALTVKACDRLANVRCCVKDLPRSQNKLEVYRSEQELFRASAYRPGLCDEVWQELEELL